MQKAKTKCQNFLCKMFPLWTNCISFSLEILSNLSLLVLLISQYVLDVIKTYWTFIIVKLSFVSLYCSLFLWKIIGKFFFQIVRSNLIMVVLLICNTWWMWLKVAGYFLPAKCLLFHCFLYLPETWDCYLGDTCSPSIL